MHKTALVTGGAKRLGRAICLHLASQGYAVLIHYFTSNSDALRTRDDCLAAGAPLAEIVGCNLDDPLERAELIPRAINLVGPIDLLVNSASKFAYDNAQSFSPQSLDSHLQTNLYAPVELTMALFQAVMNRQDGSCAHVVTLLDQKVQNLNTDYMSYTIAKLASYSSVRYLAQCCAPYLRVNSVAPGVTLVSGDMGQADFEKASKIAALGRSSTPQDIAQAILMLDAAPAITGQTIIVDGGQHLLPRGRDVAFED